MILEQFLGNYKNTIQALQVLGGLFTAFAVFTSLYLSSSHHEIRKQDKIKLNRFKKKTKKIYDEMMKLCEKFYEEKFNAGWTLLNAVKQNAGTPRFMELNEEILSSDLDAHNEQIEFYDFLKKNNIIANYWTYVSHIGTDFPHYEYRAKPTIESWRRIYRLYNKRKDVRSKKKFWKNEAKIWSRDINYKKIKNTERRRFLSLFCKSLNDTPTFDLTDSDWKGIKNASKDFIHHMDIINSLQPPQELWDCGFGFTYYNYFKRALSNNQLRELFNSINLIKDEFDNCSKLIHISKINKIDHDNFSKAKIALKKLQKYLHKNQNHYKRQQSL